MAFVQNRQIAQSFDRTDDATPYLDCVDCRAGAINSIRFTQQTTRDDSDLAGACAKGNPFIPCLRRFLASHWIGRRRDQNRKLTQAVK